MADQTPSNSSSPKRSGEILLIMICLGVIGAVGYIIFRERGSIGQETGPAIASAYQDSKSSFDLSNLAIPEDELLPGGPGKDGILSLANPKVIKAKEADYLKPSDRVIGLSIDGEARAYPLRVLLVHEIVNDKLSNQHVAVTYCPLCDSAVVFDRRREGRVIEFGVSGLLYNSNVLLYDRESKKESLWSQMSSSAISGPAIKKSLKTLPLELTTWGDWSSRFPRTTVLKIETEELYKYDFNPYTIYSEEQGLVFPVKPISDKMSNKKLVLGIWTDSAARAYPLSAFDDDHLVLDDDISGRKFTLRFNPEANSLRVEQADEGLQWAYSYWFAWYAFHPQTDIFEAPRAETAKAEK